MIFKYLFEGLELNLHLFVQYSTHCKSLDVLLVNRQISQKAKNIMFQHAFFVFDSIPKYYDRPLFQEAEHETLSLTDFSTRLPMCPFFRHIQYLKVKFEHGAPVWGFRKLQGYPELYKMFPKLQRLQVILVIHCRHHSFQTRATEELIKRTVRNLTDLSYKPMWKAYRHLSLDVSIEIKFWSWKSEAGEPVLRMRTDCLTHIRKGTVEIAKTEPGTAEEWRLLPADAEQWECALKAVPEKVSKGKLAKVLQIQW